MKLRSTPGWLTLGPDPRVFFPRTVARLLSNATGGADVLEILLHAHVKFIKGGGLMVFGQESPPVHNAPLVPQTWWCVPGTMDDLTVAE